MSSLAIRALCISLALGVVLVSSSASGETSVGQETRAKERLSGLEIPFIANAGQTDPAVAYYAQTFAGTVFITKDGRIVYSLPGEKASVPGEQFPDKSVTRNGWSLTESFIVGRAHPSMGDPAVTQVSYFRGNDPARWETGLSTFDSVSLGEVWPGIWLDLRAHGRNVEKIYTVKPGADPSRIRMGMAGARSLRVSGAGSLVVETDVGLVTFTPPEAFQERNSVRYPVRVVYVVQGQQYGFELDGYDPTVPLVIDPLMQATYLGGSTDDAPYTVAIHPISGDVYVAGGTTSMDFPGTAGGTQSASGGGDFFVARLNAALTTLNQASYLGGSGGESLITLAIHPTTGDVYVAATTSSTDFPGTAGGAQSTYGGGTNDGLVARLNGALTTLTQATYLGGSTEDVLYTLAIHPISGDVYVAGYTFSTDLPSTAGGVQPGKGGGSNGVAFVARLNAALTTLNQATYLGGSFGSRAYALAIHPTSGDIYVAGGTSSTDFPGTVGGAQPARSDGGDNNLNGDAFVARLNAALTTLNQATYLGGGGDEWAKTLAVHSTTGDVYVAGLTADFHSRNFPGTTGGAQPFYGGRSFDYFVARLNAALTTLSQATYLGGFYNEDDDGPGLAIHPTSGDVYVAGGTQSPDFPGTAGGVQATMSTSSGQTAVVARLNAALTTLNQATYLGGSGGDESTQALAIHPMSGDIYVAGLTNSTNFPGTAGGAQSANNGVGDGFVARLTADLRANNPPVCTSAQPTVASLWAPDQSMQPVSIVGITDPNNDPLTLTYPIVTQDEPIKGLFKKDLSPDAAVSGQQILLRAERGDKGDGRVYEVHFTATDIRGGSCNGTVKVRVPHSRRDTAVDSGQLYNSFGP